MPEGSVNQGSFRQTAFFCLIYQDSKVAPGDREFGISKTISRILQFLKFDTSVHGMGWEVAGGAALTWESVLTCPFLPLSLMLFPFEWLFLTLSSHLSRLLNHFFSLNFSVSHFPFAPSSSLILCSWFCVPSPFVCLVPASLWL